MNHNSLRSVLDEHPINKCSFIEHWSTDRAKKEHFVLWLEAQATLTISFGRCLARIWTDLPYELYKESRAFHHLTQLESWGADMPETHGEYYRELVESLGVDIGSALQTCPEGTFRFSEFRRKLSDKYGAEVALLTVLYGNELGNLRIFKALKIAMENIPALADAPKGYINAHLEDEEADSKIMFDLVELLLSRHTPDSSQMIWVTAETALKEFLNVRLAAFEELFERFN